MNAKIIDGRAIADSIQNSIAMEVSALKKQGIEPCLAVILVGENPASVSYVAGKERTLKEIGMRDISIRLPEATTQNELLNEIAKLNEDPLVDGILVQLPLPAHINGAAVLAAIDPKKDVDGFHPVNAGNLALGRPGFVPCTPRGIVELLKSEKIPLAGASAVVVGRSNIVGKPLALLLVSKEINATVTVCHTGTKNLADYTRRADILAVAVGRPKAITADMIKKGAVVIDVGVNRVADPDKKSGFRLVGDVDFNAAAEVAGYITPVPKGVGPMTIAMLMQNTLESAKNRLERLKSGGNA